MTLISRNGSLVSGLFGLQQNYVPERGAPTVSVTQRDADGFTYLDVVITEVSGATSYSITLVDPSDGALLASAQVSLTATLGPFDQVGAATTWLYRIAPNGGLATQASIEIQPAATAITITTQPALVFNGGEVVGATVSVSPVEFTGGPLTGPTVYTLYTSNDNFVSNRVEYAVYTGPLAAPAGWEGLRVRVEAPILGVLGTVTAISAASGVITDDDPLPVPPQPIEQDWTIRAVAAPSPQAATHHVLEYTWLGAGTPVAVQWLGQPIENYQEPSEYEHLWEDTVANTTWWTQYRLGAPVVRPNGGTGGGNYRMRYKLDLDGPWSLASVDKKFAPTEPDTPPSGVAQWHTASLRTLETVAAGLVGGSQEQAQILALRSESDPSIIYSWQDTHGAWISEDDGITMRKPPSQGLFAYFTHGGAIDPLDDQVVLYSGCARFVTEAASRVGSFRSTDGGRTYTQTLIKTDASMFRRVRPHTIVYDRSKRTTQTTTDRTWWMILPTCDENDNFLDWKLYRSDNGGQSWGSSIFTFAIGTYGPANGIYHHPTQSGVIYFCADKGLWRTTNGGTSWTNLTGNIPGWVNGGGNRVLSVEINPAGGALGSTELYVCVGNSGTANTGATGIHRSTDGGGSMTTLTVPGNPNRVVVATNSSGQWPAVGSRVMYLLGRNVSLRRSANGGGTWTTPNVSHWPNAFGDNYSINEPGAGANPGYNANILPHPTNPNVVLIFAIAKVFRSIDAGLNFGPAGAYFEGQQWHDGLAGLAFCEGSVTGAEDCAAIGVTDKGLWRTYNGAASWHFSKISYTQPSGETRKSCNLVTQCPDDLDFLICTTGHVNGGSAYLRTAVQYPLLVADGDWTVMNRTDNYPYNGHWHRSTSTICYTSSGRFTNAKAATTFSTYPGGGYLVAVAPQNNDVVFTKVGNGAAATIRKSTNAGAAFSDFVAPGWDPGDDNRKAVVAVDPGDHNILYMPGPQQGVNKDLRRFTAPSTWKTDYGFPARFRADNPTYPATLNAEVYWVAVDPEDRDTVAVSVAAPSFCEVYISYNATDATPTWERITKNMQRLSSAMLKFHPSNGDLWAGFSGYGGALVYPHPVAHSTATWTTNMIVQNVDEE